FSYDVGFYGYVYPGRKNPGVTSADTWELYGALGWKWVSVKVSYSLTDYFGARPNASQSKTDGTFYIDASATYPIGETGWAILGHAGPLDARHDGSDGDPTTAGTVGYTHGQLGVAYIVAEDLIEQIET